jgi:hypothetical protein
MSGEGEIGCLSDEIRNLAEPIERPPTEVRTGLHSLRMAWRNLVGLNISAHKKCHAMDAAVSNRRYHIHVDSTREFVRLNNK